MDRTIGQHHIEGKEGDGEEGVDEGGIKGGQAQPNRGLTSLRAAADEQPRHRQDARTLRSGKVCAAKVDTSHDDDHLVAMATRLRGQGGEEERLPNDFGPLVRAVNTRHAPPPPPPRGGTRKPRAADHPSLISAFDNEWEVWDPVVGAEFRQMEDKKVREQIRLEDIPLEEQINQLLVDLKVVWLPSGQIKKRKTRVLLNGKHQRPDGGNHYAPTPQQPSVMFVVALAVLLRLTIHDLDVPGAFLWATLPKPVYGVLPDLFRDEYGNRVYWRILKSLYGMARSSNDFYQLMSGVLKQHDYKQAPQDVCLFFKRVQRTGDFILIALHVDNLYPIATSEQLIREFIDIMVREFNVTQSEEAENILGMHVETNDDGSKELTMPRLIDELIRDCFGDEPFKGALTPMSTKFDDEVQDQSPRLKPEDVTKLRKCLGQMSFLTNNRPELHFTHNKLATRQAIATEADEEAARRAVRFLAFTQNLALVLRPSSTTVDLQALKLTTYADAAYNCHPDGKSHFGICA